MQLGMTATPLRADNKDTYRYFGNPIYTYSLREGIDDGFLAPYRVHRVVTTRRRRGVAAVARATSTDTVARFPTRNTARRISSARLTKGPYGGDRAPPHRFPRADRPVREDHRLLRRPGARRGDAAGAQ